MSSNETDEQDAQKKEYFPIYLCIILPLLGSFWSFILSYLWYNIEEYGASILFAMLGTVSACTALTGFLTKKLLKKPNF